MKIKTCPEKKSKCAHKHC